MTKLQDFEDDLKALSKQYWGEHTLVERVYPTKTSRGINVMIYNISYENIRKES